MAEKSNLIMDEIDQTRDALKEKLANLEGHLRDSVETAKDAVEGKIASVKDSFRKFSPIYQTTQYPFAMTAGAVAAGVLIGKLVAPSRSSDESYSRVGRSAGQPFFNLMPDENDVEEYETETPAVRPGRESRPMYAANVSPAKPSLVDKFRSEFSGEIEMVKGMIVGNLLDQARKLAKAKLPAYGSEIDKVINSVLHHVTSQSTEGSSKNSESVAS